MTKIDFENIFRKKSKFVEPTYFLETILEKSMKFGNFEVSKNKFRNFEIFNFHWLFSDFFQIFLVPKISMFFFRKIFSKSIFIMKKYYFCPDLFPWQGMDGYFRFRTSIRLGFALVAMVLKKTVQIPWIRSYRDLFANGITSGKR